MAGAREYRRGQSAQPTQYPLAETDVEQPLLRIPRMDRERLGARLPVVTAAKLVKAHDVHLGALKEVEGHLDHHGARARDETGRARPPAEREPLTARGGRASSARSRSAQPPAPYQRGPPAGSLFHGIPGLPPASTLIAHAHQALG